MFKTLKVSVVIPTLNEEKGIENTIASIPDVADEVIVVDGGSTDATREIAARCGAKVVLQPKRGYGLAFKTGFEHCTGDVIATTDGDGTYPIEMLIEILTELENEHLEFISCNRFPLDDSSSMRKRNWIGNYLMTMAANTLWMHSFKDILSGMWVFRRRCLKDLQLRSDSWNFSEEIKIEAFKKLGKKFQEYKIPYRERLGDTKLVPWKVGIQNICYMLALRTNTVSIIQPIVKKSSGRSTKTPHSEKQPSA